MKDTAMVLTKENEHLFRITERNQIASPLLSLPAELRNVIYTYVLTDCKWEFKLERTADHKMRTGRVLFKDQRTGGPRLPRTCRQTYFETLSIKRKPGTLRLREAPYRTLTGLSDTLSNVRFLIVDTRSYLRAGSAGAGRLGTYDLTTWLGGRKGMTFGYLPALECIQFFCLLKKEEEEDCYLRDDRAVHEQKIKEIEGKYEITEKLIGEWNPGVTVTFKLGCRSRRKNALQS